MWFDKIERECLDGELWALSPKTKLPDHLQLLVDQEQERRDIWKDQKPQKLEYKPIKKRRNYEV